MKLSNYFSKRSYLLLACILLTGLCLFFVFSVINNSYLYHIVTMNPDTVNAPVDNLFDTYFEITLYFALYILVGVVIFFKSLDNDADISLILILSYTVIIILDSINIVNLKTNQFEIFFDTVSGLLYEISVIPLVLYLTLKLKHYKKKMLILLLLESIAGLLFVIGSVSGDNNNISLLKDISCSSIFLIIFFSLYVFVFLEAKEGNADLKKYLTSLTITAALLLSITLFSALLNSGFYLSIKNSIISFKDNFDITVIRKLILQNIMIISVILNFTLEYLQKRANNKESINLLALELNMSLRYADTVKSRISDIRKIKHDMSDHLNMINMFYEKGELVKMKNYLDELRGNITELKPLSYSDNIVTDYLLMYYSEQAKESGINYDANAVIGDNVGISDGELCSLVSNIIHNSVEACKRLPPDSRKYIRFYMVKKSSKLTIECENSCLPGSVTFDNDNIPLTVKKDKSSHGLGTSIIRNICENHHGAVVFDCSDSIFKLKAVIPL